LDPSIGRESGRSSNWTAVEDSKLKDAVQTHGGNNMAAISDDKSTSLLTVWCSMQYGLTGMDTHYDFIDIRIFLR
jgi:hypothetical protein